MTTDPAPPEEDDGNKNRTYPLETNPLEHLPMRTKPERSVFVNMTLFFDYRIKVSSIEWSDLDSIESEGENESGSDVSYEYKSDKSDQDAEESDQSAEESDADHSDEGRLDDGEPHQHEEILELPIAGIFSVKEEATGIMRVLGPTEITGLLRRALCTLPSEKFVCLDEIQTLISKLEGEELLEAVRDSLGPFFDKYLDCQCPHLEFVLWKINRTLGLQGIDHKTRKELLGRRFELYSALAKLQDDGYLGLRSFLSDALIAWDAEFAIEVLRKHIAKLPINAQRSIENYARIEFDKQQELAGITEEILALDDY